ncbi:hypothetical protein ACQY0O_000633 [Thecaphora frezii]
MVQSSTQIGFVGLGNMGAPMAVNLVKKGYSVSAFDLRQPAVDDFVARSSSMSGKPVGATSALAAAAGSAFYVLMVINIEQARSILFSESSQGGASATVLSQLAPDASVILMATCPPGAVQDLEHDIQAVRSDVHLIDAPVSGGVSGATSGGLTIMVGCPQPAFDRAKPVLDCLGDKIFHIGDKVGKGSSMKAINQVLCGIHVAAAAEALALASKAGIDRGLALDIVSNSAASSWMLRDRGPRMLHDEPEVRSAIGIFIKDLGIVADAAKLHGAAVPLSMAAQQMFVAAKARGQELKDDSTVIKSYEALNGPSAKQ